MNPDMEDKWLDRGLWLLDVVFAALLVVLIPRAVTLSAVGPDAGYILPLSERIHDGMVPGRELTLGHPHAFLVMYVFAFAQWVAGGLHPYSLYVGVLVAAEVAAGVALYALLGHVTQRRSLRVAGALTVIAQLLYYEGSLVTLEPFVVLFDLLAMNACLRAKERPMLFAVAGALGCLGFWSKQYGLLFFASLGYAAWVFAETGRARLRNLVLVAAGALAVHAAVVLYFAAKGVNLVAVLEPLWWRWRVYGQGSTMAQVVKGFGWQYLAKTSFFLLALPLLLLHPASRRDKTLHILVVAFVGLSGALYVQQFAHYYQLIVPWGVALLVAIIGYAQRWLRQRPALASLAWAPYLLLLIMPLHTARMIRWFSPEARAQKLATAALVQSRIPGGKRVLVHADPSLVFFADLTPAAFESQGYKWSDFYTKEELEKVIADADYVLHDRAFGKTLRLRDGSEVPMARIGRDFCVTATIGETLAVWQKSPHEGCAALGAPAASEP